MKEEEPKEERTHYCCFHFQTQTMHINVKIWDRLSLDKLYAGTSTLEARASFLSLFHPYLPVCFSVSFSLFLSVCLYLPRPLSHSLSVSVSVYFICLSVCILLSLSLSLSLYLSISFSLNTLPLCLFTLIK